jgi:hypothetical protein
MLPSLIKQCNYSEIVCPWDFLIVKQNKSRSLIFVTEKIGGKIYEILSSFKPCDEDSGYDELHDILWT